MRAILVVIHLFCLCVFDCSITNAVLSDTNLNDLSEQQNRVFINKCCEPNELMIDSACRLAETYNKTVWQPKFKTEDGSNTKVKYYAYVTGIPNCETTEQRAIYSTAGSEDELQLLSDGRMRHVIHHQHKDGTLDNMASNNFNLHEAIPIPEVEVPVYYTHEKNKYCIDKLYRSKSNLTGLYALVCIPEVKINWRDTDFVIKKIVNPLFHAITMILLLTVSIIYFVLPTLRDLAGNIITSINVCLICAEAANLVRIFTELSNHVSFMIADVILYVSLLGAFFWLNSFGFYIWKTFKSRNVFLRVTDVRKYCYYSSVVWVSVGAMAAMAVGAHFLLDAGGARRRTHKLLSPSTDGEEQDTIGWLGIAIFFTPVAFTILFNIFFYVTTIKVIKRINIYGRIHYKLKGCFDLFLQLFLIMSVSWLFLMLSWLNFDGLLYAHVVVNLLQGVLIFYVCVVRQSHVTFLLRKSCCYAEPVPTGEWGDEMTHMNGNYNY